MGLTLLKMDGMYQDQIVGNTFATDDPIGTLHRSLPPWSLFAGTEMDLFVPVHRKASLAFGGLSWHHATVV